jgi:hypothetical protein
LKNADGKLNPSAIDTKRIPGFSTNKIPKSKRSDLNIFFAKEFAPKYLSGWQE